MLEGIEALAEFLVSEARTMERGTDSAKRQAKEEVPGDRIKDAPALARELRWRVRHASGYSSDGEGRSSRHSKSKPAVNGAPDHATNGVGNKRKRSAADIGEESMELFRNFKPPGWERVDERPAATESTVVKARRPREDSSDWAEEWLRGGENVGAGEGEEAHVERRRDVIVKVRRTATGLERQIVERVFEHWQWVGGTSASSPPVPTKPEPMDIAMAEDRPPPSQSSPDAKGGTHVGEVPVAPTPDADASSSGVQVNGRPEVAVDAN